LFTENTTKLILFFKLLSNLQGTYSHSAISFPVPHSWGNLNRYRIHTALATKTKT